MEAYLIEFTDHRGDVVKLTSTSFETAEQVAKFLSQTSSRGDVRLDDGYVPRFFRRGEQWR